MRKIKVVVLLVQQLQHGFTKNAKVSPNLTVAQICPHGPVRSCPMATTGSKSSSCSKIRHVIATFIYAIITLPKHRFESHKSVNMHA